MNEFESIVVRWMNLELLIQSEKSQKEKKTNIYNIHTHTHICMKSRKTVLMNLFAGKE